MKYENSVWAYDNHNVLIDQTAARIKADGLEDDATQLTHQALKETALSYWYGYAKTLPPEQVPLSVKAVEQQIAFIVSPQKIDELILRNPSKTNKFSSPMKCNVEYICAARYRLYNVHGIKVKLRSMGPKKRRHLKVV